ncbi:VOC family protein [Patescibacteria group bacterium]|nr:VOC family protein [Patescibacteria group bacterium]
MQKITPHLWFDKEAKEAATFYTSLFPDSAIQETTVLQDTPSGTADVVRIKIAGYELVLLNAGPYFKFNPSVSFVVSCSTAEEVDQYWKTLSEGGSVLMELAEYPFSKRYGWLQDKYGLSWQIMVADAAQIKQKITPTMMFVGAQCGKTEEAVNFYASVFHNTQVGYMLRYAGGEEPDKEGTVKHVSFTLEGLEFAAMDSARMHDFTFNEAISFIISCQTQEEVDYYWEKLSADPAAEQCGWLKDKFGFSWQVEPIELVEMMRDKDPQRVARVTQAFLKMKKFDIAKLREAYG